MQYSGVVSNIYPTICRVQNTFIPHYYYYRINHIPLLFSSSLKTGSATIISSCLSKPRLAAAPKIHEGMVLENDEKSDQIILPDGLRPELMPKHIAVIIDGHSRWAKSKGLTVEQGHDAGFANVKPLALSCCKFGIKVLTVYLISTENLGRSKEEVDNLFKHVEVNLRSYIDEIIMRNDVRLSVIGDRARLPRSLQDAISLGEEASKGNKRMHLVLGIGYGGRHEIAVATKEIATKVRDGTLQVEDITETELEKHMMMTYSLTGGYPDPDLYIRTGRAMRVSNFLLWQLSYSEFYFSKKMFPDFDQDELIDALRSFQDRERRFGLRQINH